MNDFRKPDTGEKCIRFGCGFVFGGLLAFFAVFGTWGFAISPSFMAVAVIAIVFGFLAMQFGDKFWHSDAEPKVWHSFFFWWPWW